MSGKNGKECSEGSRKKPSMKTADDVIKRVLWDDDVPSAHIVVGYEDRFLGIMERPFNEFNWCDFASLSDRETAIPRHRIVYFKYREEIVWDKRQRLDNIFGSTGGETVDQVIENYDQRRARWLAEHADEQVEDEAVEHPPVEEQVARVRRQYVDEDRPNYFVCLRVTDPALVAALRQVQCNVVAFQPALHTALIPPQKFHITLVTLQLSSEEEKQTACQVLEESRALMAGQLPSSTAFKVQGVGCFHDRCLHARLAPACQTVLGAFVKALCGKFTARGLRLAGMRSPYTPHITLAKLSRELQRQLGRIEPAAYAAHTPETDLGWQAVQGVELCEMGPQAGADGFYVRQCAPIRNSHPRPFLAPCSARLHGLVQGSGKRVVIMRGLPGSGKSSLAQQLAASAGAERAAICSADDMFVSASGAYRFEAGKLAEAHRLCAERFDALVQEGREVVIVDNTNTTSAEFQRYLQQAEARGYAVSVIEMVCTGTADLTAFHQRGTHNVPLSSMLNMLLRWVPIAGAVMVDSRGPPDARVFAPDTQGVAEGAEGETEEEGGCGESRRRGGSVCRGGEGVRQLLIFDMDGTLLATPGKLQGVPAWEALHGQRYPHASWIDRPESLALPSTVAAGPVLPLWSLCAGRGGARTVVLTGRVEALRGVTERLLAARLPGGRAPDRLLMKPTRSTLNTAQWKAEAIRGLMAESPSLESVVVWDDDPRNLAGLQSLEEEARRAGTPKLQLVDAVAAGLQLKERLFASTGGAEAGHVRAFLHQQGLLQSRQSAANGDEAVALLAGAWRGVLVGARQLSEGARAEEVVRLFGSRRLGRAGDVDLCLLAPQAWTAERCTAELCGAAAAMGLRRVYRAPSKRCPRVRVQLAFSTSAPVDVDLVFAHLLAPGLPLSAAHPAFLPRPINSGSADGADGVALAAHTERTLAERGVEAEALGMAVEVAVGVLKARGMSGSLWQGLRACHIVEVARAAVAEAEEEELGARGAEEVLRLLLQRAARMSVGEWHTLTNRHVLFRWLSLLPAVWARAASELLPGITGEALARATSPDAPRADRWSVRVSVEGDAEARWRGMLRLLSKLPVAFAGLQEEGAGVEPGPCSDCDVWLWCAPDEQSQRAVKARMAWLAKEVGAMQEQGVEATRLLVQMGPLLQPSEVLLRFNHTE